MTHLSPSAPRLAGIGLAAVSAVALFAMAHHPTLGGGEGSLASEAWAERGINRAVHGVMIAFVLIVQLSLSVLGDGLGRAYLSVRAAGLALSVATISMVGAALCSGFVVTALAGTSVSDADFETLMRFSYAINQTLAPLATVGYGAALLLFAPRLFRGDRLAKVTAILGVVVGAALVAAMLLGAVTLHVHGMMAVLVALVLWFGAAAAVLIRTKGAHHETL